MAAQQSKIKICGLTEEIAVETAISAGADFLGFVFYEPSPRHLSYETAANLARTVEGRAKVVALSVDAPLAIFDAIMTALDPDYFQLHGSETPDQVAALKKRFGKPVIKAIKIAGPDDLAALPDYQDIADILLFDARTPAGSTATLPGGNGIAFDWDILNRAGLDGKFMLSGGLEPANAGDAIARLHPDYLDVSSGVERTPGKKDPDLIRAFAEAVRKANLQEHAA